MKRILIPFLAAFALGLTGAAGALVLKGRAAATTTVTNGLAERQNLSDNISFVL